MSKKDKLIKKLMAKSKTFTFDDLTALLNYFEYVVDNRGKTSGSRVGFVNQKTEDKILLHKPHGRKELLSYQINEVIKILQDRGIL